ncbi:MAG: hypothetical protein KDA60_22160 [Planctomycetales bacterium]|nr:hypothetical protein [Planctomycetales bacterium]
MKKLHAVLRLPLHDFFVLSQGDAGFRAYVFLNSDEDVMACKRSGDLADIEDCVYEQLEMAGRGTRNEIVVAFEYDSDENVQRSFKGNYYLRLL